jgi:3-deoxy-D-manno-octulosonate 8-phosphate phosphatase (KDO 8-P phosphatase)
MNYKEKLKDIQLFCFDVDGVFTDNIVYLTPDGDQMRTANVKDGYAVQLAVKKGIQIAIISGGKSEPVRKRFEMLGVREIHLGASDKWTVYQDLLLRLSLTNEQVCYMGDDIPDYPIMKQIGLAVCPSDAAPEIKSVAHYISPFAGGSGCVRDILEQCLKVKGLWFDEESLHW